MRIGFVTDEISPDIKEAIEIGVSWQIKDYEIRVVGNNRIPHISEADIQQIIDLKNKHNLQITALSPGTFKNGLSDTQQIEHEINEVLPKTFRLAKLFDSKMVIVFGIKRAEGDLPENEEKVIAIFQQVAKMAQNEGLTVAVENEPGFWCDSGSGTARILEKVNSPYFKANWDPANAAGTTETPFPDGYETLKKWIVNVHIKDTKKSALLKCFPVGEGIIDWPGQIKALLKDKPVEHVTIETHCLPLVEKSKHNLKVIRKLLQE